MNERTAFRAARAPSADVRPQTIPVALFGATGYAGREAARLLAAHPAFRLASAFGGRDREGAPLSAIHPSLHGAADLPCGALDGAGGIEAAAAAAGASGATLALLATPEVTSVALAPALLRCGMRVVDLSGAFRLRTPQAFAEWYGRGHARPDLLERAAYGLTEWADGALSRADLVANPGCYPTAALLALLPLRRADVVDLSAPVVIQAISGASGAGRRLREDLLFCEVEGSVRPYGLPRHRHLGEIAERAALVPGAEVVFLPHLVPIERGLLCTITLRLRAGFDSRSVAEIFARAYSHAPFVRILGEGAIPATGDVRGTNACALGWTRVPGTRQLILMSAIDNLVKGAAGQAIQNLNLMAGRPEEEGLPR